MLRWQFDFKQESVAGESQGSTWLPQMFFFFSFKKTQRTLLEHLRSFLCLAKTQESACLILRLISSLPPRKQNESRTITKDREKRGIGAVINIYLPALGICAILVWICRLTFKCLNDLFGRSWVSLLSTVTVNHLCIHIYRFIHITYSW